MRKNWSDGYVRDGGDERWGMDEKDHEMRKRGEEVAAKAKAGRGEEMVKAKRVV